MCRTQHSNKGKKKEEERDMKDKLWADFCFHFPSVNKTFPSAELLLAGCFLFVTPLRVKTPETVVGVKIKQAFSFRNTQTTLSVFHNNQRAPSPSWCLLTWRLSEAPDLYLHNCVTVWVTATSWSEVAIQSKQSRSVELGWDHPGGL